MNSKDNPILEPILNLYLKKDYTASIEELIKVKGKLDKGLFYYNLGSLQLKTKAYGDARHSFEMAKLHGFESAEVFHNTKFLDSTLGLDDLSTSKELSDQTIIFFKSLAPSAYLSFSLVLILSALIVKKFISKSNVIFFTIFVLASSPILFKFFLVDQWQIAFAKERARVFSGPSEVFTDSGELSDGTKLLIGKSSGKWFFIDRPRHLSGWLSSEDLRIVSKEE